MSEEIKTLRTDLAHAATENVLDIIGAFLKFEEVPGIRAELVVCMESVLEGYDELRAAFEPVTIEPSVN